MSDRQNQRRRYSVMFEFSSGTRDVLTAWETDRTPDIELGFEMLRDGSLEGGDAAGSSTSG